MTRDEQVDVVAQAIRRAFETRTKHAKHANWQKLGEQVREGFRFEARAAIEAYEFTLIPASHTLNNETAAALDRAQ